MTTPRLMVLTDRLMAANAGHEVVDVVAAAVDGGAPLVVLREKDLPRDHRRRLARRLRGVTADAGATLVVAGDAALAREVEADGVHLAAGDAWPDDAGGALWVGRSCHTRSELVAAADNGIAGYATFSPVFATTSKPGYGPALGIDGLADGCRAVGGAAGALAVYALGGIVPGRAAACRATGATGVAVMGTVMGAEDPGAVVRSLLGEVADHSGVPDAEISAQGTPEVGAGGA
jgi:thiamine-phosphate pyrophosphorylase